MNASLRKVGALFGKDFVDLFKNPGMAVALVFPVGLVAVQCWMAVGSLDGLDIATEHLSEANALLAGSMLLSAICMTVAMVGLMAVLYGIAEEREKHTLRTLMLSNVSAGQVVVAKSAVALVAIFLVEALCFAVVRLFLPVDMALVAPYLGLGLVGAVPLLLVSLVLGLACRDQMTAGFYSVPVILLALAPMFGLYGESIERVTRWLPLGAIGDLLELAMGDRLLSADALVPVLVTLAWIVIGAALFGALFRRLARDN